MCSDEYVCRCTKRRQAGWRGNAAGETSIRSGHLPSLFPWHVHPRPPRELEVCTRLGSPACHGKISASDVSFNVKTVYSGHILVQFMFSRRAVDCLWHLLRSFLWQGEWCCRAGRWSFSRLQGRPFLCQQTPIRFVLRVQLNAKSCKVMLSHFKQICCGIFIAVVDCCSCSLLLVRFGPSLRISWHRQRRLRSAQQRCKV